MAKKQFNLSSGLSSSDKKLMKQVNKLNKKAAGQQARNRKAIKKEAKRQRQSSPV